MRPFMRIAAAVLALFFAAGSSQAAMSAAEKTEIEQVIHDYLLANPEVLEEAYQALQDKRQAEKATAEKKAIADDHDLIFSSSNQMVLGNPQGDVTLVEFFDYNCTYCRHAVSDMLSLLDANPDLRIVMKEFPILAPGSVEAARISVAVKDLVPDRYLDFHKELFSRPGEATGEKAIEVASDLGLDVDALKAAAAKPDVTANIEEVHKLATDLGISGTPSYVIGTEVIPGAIGYDGLQAKVTAVRDCGATVC